MKAIDTVAESDALVEFAETWPFPPGVSIGRFAGLDEAGRFQVALTASAAPIIALSVVALTLEDMGARLAIAFEGGDARRPIIMGRVIERQTPVASRANGVEERLVIRAEREIELRCGDASIVLTQAGKVLIRGNYVLSRSRGANKVKGAVVDIN